MIDIHCHILPSLDDGAKTMAESLDMAKMAVEDGIHTIIATPHHADGRYENDARKIQDAVQELKSELEKHRISLNVVPGSEIRMYHQLLDDLQAGIALPLNGGKYVLLELPSGTIPPSVPELIHELRVMDLVPIIAHPERNAAIAKDSDNLLQLIRLGALSQITSHSLTGAFGTRIRKLSISLVRKNMVHFVASDAHNSTDRAFNIHAAYQYITERLGPHYSNYFIHNARCVLEHATVEQMKNPVRKKKKIFSLTRKIW
jgi:protein-tyrosine phosphatase